MHINAHLDIDMLAIDEDDQVTCLVELTAPTDTGSAQRLEIESTRTWASSTK